MSKKKFILFVSAAIGFNGVFAANPDKRNTSRPNVLFILADDQGYGDFGCFGNQYLETPALDKLHNQSTTFSKFIMSPVCAPSRASLMTGRYNYRTGVWDTWKARCNMNGNEKTVAEYLRESGYKTALFGKWHLGYNTPLRPVDQGFEETFTWEEYAKDSRTRINPVMSVNGGKPKEYKGFLDDVIFDRAIKFLQEKSKTKEPFFACVASFLPHDCDTPVVPVKYIRKFDKYDLSPHTKEVYGMVEKLDENVGRILKAIDDLGLSQNTIIIYTSDNGAQLSGPRDAERGAKPQNRFNRGMRGGKTSVYDGGIVLPCFFRWPGVFEEGRTIKTQAAHIDLLPTILDICGVRPSIENVPKIDGISLFPYLRDSAAIIPQRNIIIQSDRSDVPSPFISSCVRGDKYKLVNGRDLYDLGNDPAEKNSIADSKPEIVTALRAEYNAWYQSILNESGFTPSPEFLSSPAQDEITLQFFNRSSKGWPIRALNEGPYHVALENFDPSLFPEGGWACLDFNGVKYKTKLPKTPGLVKFNNVRIPVGEYFLNVYTEGYKIPKKGRWDEEDVGYRNVIVKKSK